MERESPVPVPAPAPIFGGEAVTSCAWPTTVAVTAGTGVLFALLVGATPVADLPPTSPDETAVLLYTGLSGMLALGVLYLALTRWIVRPMEGLTRAAEEERAVLAQRRELVATVASGVTSLAGTMIGGIEALVNGQRGALARALADFTKDLAVRSGLKALEEFMLAAASAASYNFPAAAAHTTAGGMALAVAAAAGGASAGLGAAASSAAGGGAGGASGGAGGGGGAGGATGGAVAGGDTGRSSYVSDAAKLREERYLANEATNSAGYTQKDWAKFRAGGGLSQMQGWNEDGTERSRLDRLEVPRSGDRQGTMASGPVININVTGPVGKDTVRAIGETTRRAMDKTKAQGPRP